ncbi:MAG: 50S ribosomal protein L5 [Chloroflexi bacterium]|nr:50S ribosomal protein L5 [Chloroflexota bacterium]MDA1002584.1 50S ribosomal protein L5 [Chloroflexota bacterium]MQC27655.1 50S ribosomal protein L5 [Chloroflexota bacterium]
MVTETYVPRMLARYRDEVAPQLQRDFGYANVMQIPALRKMSINIGLGEAIENGNAVDSATKDLLAITGQRPFIRRSTRAISNFKLREGMPIGVALTLRGHRMWEFYDRLVNASLPRVRDFRGVPDESFDGHGNYSLGLSEQLLFPEVSFDTVDRVRGLQVNIVTSARNDEEGKRLLELLGMPFVRR